MRLKVKIDFLQVLLDEKKMFCEVPNYTFDVFVRPSVCDIYIN